MRVALLNPCFWPEVRRGSERLAWELAAGLATHGVEAEIVTSHPGPTARTLEQGVAVTRLRRPPGNRRLAPRFGFDYVTHAPLSYGRLRRGRFDLVHALYPIDALAANRWGAVTGRPAVFSMMGIPVREYLAEHRRRTALIRRAVAGAAAVTALSDAARSAFRRELGVDARVIAPGVDLERFAPGGQRAAVPTIFCAADLEQPRKRVDLVVEATRRLRADAADTRLVLARPRTRTAPGLPEWVELRDVDDDADLARAHRDAWVSVLASRGEAFGLVLVESLACGTPVVAANDGGMPEIVNDESIGRLFAGGTAEALAGALREGLELGRTEDVVERCRARAESFSTRRCAGAFAALYRELAATADATRSSVER